MNISLLDLFGEKVCTVPQALHNTRMNFGNRANLLRKVINGRLLLTMSCLQRWKTWP